MSSIKTLGVRILGKLGTMKKVKLTTNYAAQTENETWGKSNKKNKRKTTDIYTKIRERIKSQYLQGSRYKIKQEKSWESQKLIVHTHKWPHLTS